MTVEAIAKPVTRVGMISLGCPKNLVDSEIMLGRLARQGYEVVPEGEEAETVVINTCAFIEEAQQESIDTILEVVGRKGHGVEKVLVAGCMVNRFGQDLAREIPEIDGFVGLDQLREVGQLVQLGGGPPLPAPSHMVFDHTAPRLVTTRGYAYLKVAEGCNNPCTFCAIPIWRGRFRSRTIESLVAEARDLAAQGVQELCLIAQDTTRYGEDIDLGRHGLAKLVEALLRGTDIPWIRFLYAYPTTLDEDLLRLMGSEERFCSYVDMPLQHSHGEVLARMRRGGDAKRYLRLLERARELARSTSRTSWASSRKPASITWAPSPTAPRRGRRRPSCRGGCRSTWRAAACASSWRRRSRSRSPSASAWWGSGSRCSSRASARTPSICSRAAITAWPPTSTAGC
jgi:ribosomal protein S12 methylthiotransferase